MGRVLEGDGVSSFVSALGEVKIVGQCVLAALLGGVEIDCHVEFTPALVLASEGRRGEGYARRCVS